MNRFFPKQRVGLPVSAQRLLFCRSADRWTAGLLAVLILILLVPQTPAQAELVAVTASRMLDVASGAIVSNPVILIRGERIEGVAAEAPPSARIIDLGDVTLLPGLIDSHTHLTSQLGPDSFSRVVRKTEADNAMTATFYARRTVRAGFTTVRDYGAGIDVALMRAVDQRIVEGPRIVPSRHPLGITGGHCDVTGLAPGIRESDWRGGVADGVDEVLKAVRYQIKHGARVIKTCATAGVLSFEEAVGAQQYTFEELEAMVDEAARHGIKVAAHAHGVVGIKAAIRAGVASIEHGSVLDDEAIQMMLDRGTYLVPTTYLTEAIDLNILPPPIRTKAETILPIARQSLQKAIRAGVKIAFGTDAGVYPHGDNAREFASLVQRGMTPLAAIQSATINAADLLDVNDRGKLEAGLLADIIAVPGNPLEDITVLQRVGFVMQGGRTIVGPQ